MTFLASEVEEKSIPEEFIHVFRKKKYIECQTLDLWKRNQRVIMFIKKFKIHLPQNALTFIDVVFT